LFPQPVKIVGIARAEKDLDRFHERQVTLRMGAKRRPEKSRVSLETLVRSGKNQTSTWKFGRRPLGKKQTSTWKSGRRPLGKKQTSTWKFGRRPLGKKQVLRGELDHLGASGPLKCGNIS
jgi:hypothetical protein